MMNIAVVAANGRVGKLIVKEAKKRDMNVTSFVRKQDGQSEENVIVKDIFDLNKEDLNGFDAVVDAVGAWTPESAHVIPDAAKHLADLLKGTDTRLLVIGGAGNLFVNPEHTKTVLDVTDFPAEALPTVKAHQEAVDSLRKYSDVKWTYLSPAGEFNSDGEKSGKYILSDEELTLNAKGESIISYADYALAMVDEIESGNHTKQAISVVRE